MAFQRRGSSWRLVLAIALAAALLLSCQLAATANKRTGQLTVFWGRNKGEGTLREACDTGLYNTVVISFLSVFGHGHYGLDLSGYPLHGVGADIKHCQRSKGIPVFLSISGGSGSSNYSLPSAASAEAVATHLWNAYLGSGSGDAVVDGIDFYIDDHGDGGGSSSSSKYYAELTRRLDYFNSLHYHAAKKHVRLTATPRCAFM